MVHHTNIQKMIFFLLIIVCIISVESLATNRTISIDLELTSDGINRYIAGQTFPTLNGTAPGGQTYTITISPPLVQFSPGSAKVQFTIKAITSVGTFSYTVEPTILIPSTSISTSQVNAFLQGFDGLINSIEEIPSWLKPIIINGYNNLNLVVYPSKLIDYANSMIPDYLKIQVVDISFSWAALEGKLKFTLAVVVEGSPGIYTAEWLKPGPYEIRFRFGADVASNVKMVRFYALNGSEIWRNDNLNWSIPKGGHSQEHYISCCISVGSYYMTVFFTSPYGQYVRNYYFTYNTATYNVWFPMTLGSSIN